MSVLLIRKQLLLLPGAVRIQHGGSHQLADRHALQVIRIQRVVGSSIFLHGDIVLAVLAEFDRDGGVLPHRLSDILAVLAPVGLSEGDLQIGLLGVPAVRAHEVVVGTGDEVDAALVLLVFMLDVELLALDNQSLEDLQSVMIVAAHGDDETIIGQSHDEDIAVIAGIGRSPDGHTGSLGTLTLHRADAGIGRRDQRTVVSADGPGEALQLPSLLVLASGHRGGLDHNAVVGLIILGPGILPDDFLSNQMVVDIKERHTFRVLSKYVLSSSKRAGGFPMRLDACTRIFKFIAGNHGKKERNDF